VHDHALDHRSNADMIVAPVGNELHLAPRGCIATPAAKCATAASLL
jgi:hypothetical protein